MKRLLDGVHSWSVFNEAKGVDFNGYHLDLHTGFALIDPPPLSDREAERIDGLGRPHVIVVTNRDHVRAAPEARQRFGAPIAVHELDARLVDCAVDRTFTDDDLLCGALHAVHLRHQKSPGETALYWRNRRILVLGDALWGKPKGRLTMLPDAKYPDAARAREGLQRLGSVGEVEALLVGDGAPILEGGGDVLRQYLAGLTEAG